MKNVTITLDEDVAAWARVEAAKSGKSLSRYLGDRLAAEMRGRADGRSTFQRFLDAPDFPGVAGDLPSREELYAERVFHRHERAPVREGPEAANKAGTRARVAGRSRR